VEQTVEVPVVDDVLDENLEAVFVGLSAAVGATVGDALGVGVIIDDDPPPTVLPGWTSIVEGNSGVRQLILPVSLSTPSGRTVTVRWTTADGSATAPHDYAAASGTVTFAAGETQKLVSVPIAGDVIDENDEHLVVSFHAPVNATLGGFFGIAIGMILDDEVSPKIRPGWATVVEGDSGTRTLSIPVALSSPTPRRISFEWSTRDGSALAPLDYVAASGTATFEPGQTALTIDIVVRGDGDVELDEAVFLDLRAGLGARLGGLGGAGVGVIVDDD
jgi:hypothetical protein